jgi:hypothetical protein
LRIARWTVAFAASVGFGWCFVWLAFQHPAAMPYVVTLIAASLLAQLWLDIREERKRAAAGRAEDLGQGTPDKAVSDA